MLVGLVTLGLVVIVAFAALGWWSQRGAPAGLAEGRLAPCGPAPNCVCSEYGEPSDPHRVAALARPADDAQARRALRDAVHALGGRIVSEHGDYVHATFTSRVFRFVDDVELHLLPERIEIRSAARVGYSDWGVNRRRVEALRAALAAR